MVLLLLIALLLFGAKRLPEIGRSLGSGMREFKDSVNESQKPAELTQSVETVSTVRDEHETTV
jgi:sec-independent protein translocase protein TatA